MSLGDWIRRLFSPSSSADPEEPDPGIAGPGITAYADLESAEAAEDAEAATEPPADPAS